MKPLFATLVAALACSASMRAADPVSPPPPPPAETPAASSSSATPAHAAGRAALQHAAAGMGQLMKIIETKGKITKEEFLAHAKKEAEERFSKLDSNSDGAIDKAELDAVTGRLKGAREKFQERRKGDSSIRKRPGADDKPSTSSTSGSGSNPEK